MGTLYQKLMGTEFSNLAPLLQRFHVELDKDWVGEAQISWCKNPLLRAFLWLAGLPKEANHQPITVHITPGGSSEQWIRRFGKSHMASKQKLQGSGLQENFGPIALILHSHIRQGALHQSCSRSGLLGIPLPSPFAFRISAREWQENGRFNFDVQIGVAALSLIRYRGWLLPHNLEV